VRKMGVISWFKYKSPFGLAFALQRITGIILLFYLILHLSYLTSLQSRELYETLTSITVSRQFIIFDSLLILCGVFHGVNGIRIIIHELGIGHELRRVVLAVSAIIVILGWIIGSYILFMALGD